MRTSFGPRNMRAAWCPMCRRCEIMTLTGERPVGETRISHCNTCHRSWARLRELHCCTCHQHFVSVQAADAHRCSANTRVEDLVSEADGCTPHATAERFLYARIDAFGLSWAVTPSTGT